MIVSHFVLLMACVHSARTTAVDEDSSCAEPRAKLETAVTLVSSLERQLYEARQIVIAKQLIVRSCELGVNTTASQRSSEAVRTNGQSDSSDAGNQSLVRGSHTVCHAAAGSCTAAARVQNRW
jgi:hypothetical protein